MLADLINRYAWADDYSQEGIEGWTVAVIEGRSSDEIIRIYGGDPGRSVGEFTFAQAYELQGELRPSPGGYTVDSGINFHLQVQERDHYVVALENNGWTGQMPEIARRCSMDGGRFFAVYWSLSSNPQINQAIDGHVTAHFETWSGDKPYDREPAPQWIKRISIELDHLRSTALALMEQQTGLAFDQYWLNEMRPTYWIPDPDWMLRDVPNARTP